ncbi:MAG: T9SS type A sorting domain-containing protein [Ignavibacteria bacterium]|nr:T9SS type A sorting domain-containing protein [Ignavibacteria bacterium]
MRLFFCTLLILSFSFICTKADSLRVAGFRASRILSSYPNNQFPSADYWVSTGRLMAGKFPSANPASIWIVSLYLSNGITQLNFPNPGGNYPYINFISTDQNESYLTRFDQEGFKVWLQVEPGAASIDTLIHLVLNRYKHHPCVKGFGIDVEWYLANLYPGGKKVTNEEAQRWEQKVKSFDTSYTLFLKHYGQSWMPPNYRGQIFFVDDSQDFNFSSNPFNAMVNEFKSWGQKFFPNKVGFQYGYRADTTWWKKLNDPPATIGNTLIANIPNCYGLFWVDFTITQVFPITSVGNYSIRENSFKLFQNFPNPFNSSTTIKFSIPKSAFITLKVYDVLGREVATLVEKILTPGLHNFEFRIPNSTLSSGVYFYKMCVGSYIETKKMLYLK